MNQSTATMPPFPWQTVFWEAFVARANSAKLPHATLLAGIPGIGVAALGRAMAEYLLCNAPRELSTCGSCKSCQLIAGHSHPDYFVLSPEEKSKVIKVDQVRLLTEFVSKTAQQGGRKLIVIEPAEAMNPSAANALLKCLEEPAGDTVFILVSTAPNRLMATIRSRCATQVLGVPPRADAIAWLQEMEVDQAAALLDEAQGAPVTAHAWWRDSQLKERDTTCAELVAVLTGQKTPVATAAHWATRYDTLEITELLIQWLEKLLRARAIAPDSVLLSDWQALQAATCAVSDILLYRLLDSLMRRKAQLLANPNLNTGMVVEELLLDWVAVAKRASRRKTRAIVP